jgi:hypothetical protein
MPDGLFAGIFSPYAKPKASLDLPLCATIVGKTVLLPGALRGSKTTIDRPKYEHARILCAFGPRCGCPTMNKLPSLKKGSLLLYNPQH